MVMPEPPAQESPSTWRQVAGVTALLSAVIALFLIAFALPMLHSEPQNIPVALVAPEQVSAVIETGVEDASPGAFELVAADDAEAAREMILNREVYAALLVTAEGLTIETASAASYAVASATAAAAEEIGTALSLPVTVDDVAPLPEADPRGVGLSAGGLPLALGGWIAAVGILATIRGTKQRLIAAGSFALLGGFALTAVLQFWFGTFTGDYVLTSLAACLGIAATSALVLGLQSMFKVAGIVVAAIVLILLGNPLSGLTSAPELLPTPWGAIGQLLPPGATGTLLRNTAYFDGAATAAPIIVLTVWLVLGLGLYLLAAYRTRTPQRRGDIPAAR